MRLTLQIQNASDHDIILLADALWADNVGRVLTHDTDGMYMPSLYDIEYLLYGHMADDRGLHLDLEGPPDLECPAAQPPHCPHIEKAVATIGPRVRTYAVDPRHGPSSEE